jgi:nucleoside 2-deoxyribosyltransferase
MLRRVAKVYIAGSSYETERAERATAALLERGVHVTATWPRVVRTVGSPNPRGATVSDRFRWSVDDLAQVRDADLLWFLVPPIAPAEAHTRGGWVEVGYALGLGKLVIFSGDTKQSIFCALGYEVIDDTDALRVIADIASQAEVELANARTEATRWKLTAQNLARRLQSLKGIADSDVDAVLRGEIGEGARG